MKKEDRQSSRAHKAIQTNLLYKKVFGNHEGEAVLRDLMVATGFDDTTFVPGDPYSSAFNEGRRSLITQILRTIDISPEIYRKMYEKIEDEKEILDA